MTKGSRVRTSALLICLVAAQILQAYERPLSSYGIREAYFLGQRNDEKTAAFLERYRKQFPMPKSGPHVAAIDIQTPYVRVVNRCRQISVGYSAQQAQKDYKAQSDLILVRVWINLTPTFTFQRYDFWRDFTIRLVQGYPIAYSRIRGNPIYAPRFGLIGAEVLMEFDAAEVASAPAQIEVLTPDGQRVVAEFDLGTLR